MRIRRRTTLLVGAVAAVAVAVPAAAAQATTKVVNMGLPLNQQKTFNDKLGSDVNDFFPHGTTIHIGDSVKFVPVGFHTVDLAAKGKDPLPLVNAGPAIAGKTDPAGAAYWFNGLPSLGFNPALFPNIYGKKVSFNAKKEVESGLPLSDSPKPFTVKFKKTGSFTYYCNVHPGMVGVVKVVRKSKKIPNAKADKKTLKKQISKDLAIAKTLSKVKPPAGVVDVGSAGKNGVEWYGFLTQKTTIPVGTTLTFQMTNRSREVHTATTGPGNPDDATSFIGKLAASVNSPAFDQAAVYATDKPPAAASLTKTSHGIGFWGSGFLDVDSATPLAKSSKVTFAQAGTYDFYCMIHPFMHIQIKVT